MSTGAQPAGPWSAAQLRLVAIGGILGLALFALAVLGTARTPDVDTQLSWVSLAVVALMVAASPGAMLILWARRAILRRRRLLVADHRPEPVTVAAQGGLVWLPGTARAHRSDCQLIVGKPGQPVRGAELADRGLVRCELCA